MPILLILHVHYTIEILSSSFSENGLLSDKMFISSLKQTKVYTSSSLVKTQKMPYSDFTRYMMC